MTKLFLFDIEGTTTDISFVHQVLFPYARERMESFVKENQSESIVRASIDQVKSAVLDEDGEKLESLDSIIAKLIFWIDTDRKHPALKTLQGLIWDRGYTNEDFKGHVYEDVKPFFKKLKSLGHTIGIYSSGSVHAQKLIFTHSTDGDLTPYITFYFDTKVGPKRESSSYENIIRTVSFNASDITFFSDIPQELAASKIAGMNPVHLVRPGTAKSPFSGINDFGQFEV